MLATKERSATKSSVFPYPRVFLFTALKALLSPALKAVLNSPCQWAGIPSRGFSLLRPDGSKGASRRPRLSPLALGPIDSTRPAGGAPSAASAPCGRGRLSSRRTWQAWPGARGGRSKRSHGAAWPSVRFARFLRPRSRAPFRDSFVSWQPARASRRRTSPGTDRTPSWRSATPRAPPCDRPGSGPSPGACARAEARGAGPCPPTVPAPSTPSSRSGHEPGAAPTGSRCAGRKRRGAARSATRQDRATRSRCRRTALPDTGESASVGRSREPRRETVPRPRSPTRRPLTSQGSPN